VIKLVGVAVLSLLPSTAFAQGGQPGPFGGLFGRTPERVGREYTLFEVRSAASVQADDQMLNSAGVPDEGIGMIGGVNLAALFDRRTSRLQMQLRSAASYQEFIQTPPVGATTYENSGMMTWRLATRLSLEGSATYRYSPYFQFFPNLVTAPYVPGVVPPSIPYVAGLVESDTVEATGGFTSYYSKHSTISASLMRRQTTFRHNAAGDFEANGVRALWTRRTGRDASVNLGYAREESRSDELGGIEYLNESIEAGINFDRPLSLTRNTTLAVTTASSIIRRNGGSRHFRLNGGVVLGHVLSRSWRLDVSANRNTEFLAGFAEPLFSDTAGVAVAGLIASRAELFLSANGGSGYFGIDGDRGSFRTATTTAQLNVAVTRKFGVFAQYGVFYYEIPPNVTLLTTMQQLSRQSLTVGVMAWLPIINRERSTSDSR
jgi:hypothetical protein